MITLNTEGLISAIEKLLNYKADLEAKLSTAEAAARQAHVAGLREARRIVNRVDSGVNNWELDRCNVRIDAAIARAKERE